MFSTCFLFIYLFFLFKDIFLHLPLFGTHTLVGKLSRVLEPPLHLYKLTTSVK